VKRPFGPLSGRRLLFLGGDIYPNLGYYSLDSLASSVYFLSIRGIGV
jgi:hypothetical protein